MSASTEKRELYREEFTPRNDVVELLSTRRQNRRSRRNRKTRYRAPRFDNRVHSKHKGWLAPSVEVKIQEHITVIKRICRILPITLVRVETAEFDTQRLKAMLKGKPLPVGTDYQLGEMYDEYNVRQYVLKRDNYTCQCCGAHPTEKKPIRLHVHHIESRHPDYLMRGMPQGTPRGKNHIGQRQKARQAAARRRLHGHHAQHAARTTEG